MGVDCVFIVDNVKGVRIETFAEDLRLGKYPGGTGTFVIDGDVTPGSPDEYELTEPRDAYHWLEFYEHRRRAGNSKAYILVHDGNRLPPFRSDIDYVCEIADYFGEKCGGTVWLYGDMHSFDFVEGQPPPLHHDRILRSAPK